MYSARAHFEAAGRWNRAHLRIGVPMTLLAAVAGGSAIANNTLVAAIVGVVVTALSALSVFLNPTDKAAQHHAAGTRFNEVRNLARVYREIELIAQDQQNTLVDRLKSLGTQRDELNKASPQIPRWAFKLARRSIEAGEASYAVDQRASKHLKR